ncbi:putative quinol monooxygenase [Actinomadura miaoliensis]|uniref:putative quinol monooxygenase n=1 Tax=Actinomadura miaoliensis TaxID=430685 RepID=UPI0031EBFD79
MVDALLALPATLGALVATGLLISRASKDRSLYLIAWSVTMVGLSLALAAMAIGFLFGWAGPLFRVSELGAALLAPVWLALGMIELIARYVQVRFAAWLFAVSYSVVATVILLVDPLRGSFSKSLPKPGDTYDAIPLLLVDGAHVVAVVALVACAAFTAVLASKQDREAGELLIPIALLALAGVLIVSGSRGFLPAPLAILALGAAAGLVWYGATRTIPVYADEAYDGEEPATGYDDEGYDDQGYDERGRGDRGYADASDRGYADQAYGAAAAEQAPAAAPPAAKRGDLRFPEQQVEEPRFAEPPSPSSTVDDAVAAAAAGAGAGRTSAACGQITVYTLLDGREEAFDRLADELVQAAIAAEPDTVIFACHEVVGAPTQRIFYQLFRDEAAFAAHRGQAHLRRFMAESRTHVIATNVIEMRLGSAKLPPLPQPRPPSAHGVPDFP